MNGVRFGDIHSYNDLHLILAPFTPEPAKPRTNFLDVPGRDGKLDLTEANGEVKFDSRKFKFTFTIAPGDDLTFDERVTKVSNALNGLRCKITLDRDPDYYWLGRCEINKYEQDRNIGTIVVQATVDPYKLKQEETRVVCAPSPGGSSSYTLMNDRMPAVPTIECIIGGVTLSQGDKQWVLNVGTHRYLGFRFVEGENKIVITNDTDQVVALLFTWQEGAL